MVVVEAFREDRGKRQLIGEILGLLRKRKKKGNAQLDFARPVRFNAALIY